MGIFGISNKEAMIKQKECIQAYTDIRSKYLKIAESEEDALTILNQTLDMMGTFDAKAVAKEMKKNKLNAEATVMNMVQNMAMMYVQQSDMKSIMLGLDEAKEAYKMYCYINDEKLKKGYISNKQYSENDQLIKHLMYNK